MLLVNGWIVPSFFERTYNARMRAGRAVAAAWIAHKADATEATGAALRAAARARNRAQAVYNKRYGNL